MTTDQQNKERSPVEPDGASRARSDETTAPVGGTAEQEAKRVEKVRSHASSHHVAGTVPVDDDPVGEEVDADQGEERC